MIREHEDIEKIYFLTVIIGRKQADALLKALAETGAHLVNALYGRGTVRAGSLQNALGLVPEENKVVVTCLMTCNNANAVLQMLLDKFHLDKPNTGVAFTIPVDRVSF